MWVARVYSRRMAKSERSTRPPSMGKAGSRLKSTNETLTSIRRSIDRPAADGRSSEGLPGAGDEQPAEQQDGNDQVDRRTSQGDPKLLDGFFGHALQTGDAADGVEGDVAGFDAVAAGGEGVPVLVEHDQTEQKQDEEYAVQRASQGAGLLPIGEAGPTDNQEEGGVNEHVNPGEGSNFP